MCVCVFVAVSFRTTINGYRVIAGGKTAGGVALTSHPPSTADGKERVDLVIYTPSGPSLPFLESNSSF